MGFERRFEIYFRNKSDRPQTLKHRRLTEVAALPAMPGGYILASGGAFVVQPGQAVKAPMTIWNTTPCAMNLWWTEEITEKQYLALAAMDQDVRPEVDTRSWWRFDGRRVRIDDVREKRVYFTDEAGVQSWTSRARWEEEAVEEQPAASGQPSATELELQKHLADCAEEYSDYVSAIDEALGKPRDLVEGNRLAQHLAAIQKLKEASSFAKASDSAEATSDKSEDEADPTSLTEGELRRAGEGFADPDEEEESVVGSQ